MKETSSTSEPASGADKTSTDILGLSVVPLSAETAHMYNVQAESGVIVSRVVADSPADDAHLQRGDVLQEMNGVNIKDPAHFAKMLANVHSGSVVRLLVQRQESLLYTTVSVQ
jgi:S1-C subfamily serine protease